MFIFYYDSIYFNKNQTKVGKSFLLLKVYKLLFANLCIFNENDILSKLGVEKQQLM